MSLQAHGIYKQWRISGGPLDDDLPPPIGVTRFFPLMVKRREIWSVNSR